MQKKLDEKEICQKECKAACCKHYYITLLPFEAEKLAKSQKTSLKDFLEKYTIQYFKEISFESSGKKILLQNIALKRIDGKCILLSDENLCKVYLARPRQCKLFPFLALDDSSDIRKAYPFCLLVQQLSRKPTFDKKHYEKVKKYYLDVEEKGFENVWPALPKEKIVEKK
ncbi:MAG: YkgJ family cysteine cluster protein [archaeon]